MIEGVRRHKYACVDSSPLSNYVMHPFWDKVVEYCPKWVAPNLLTVLGFGFTVLNFFMLTYYDPDLKSPDHIPRVVWIISAFFIFAAHTLDGIDGKQARRLGVSTPLGELLDHCCDAWTASFLPLALFSLFSGHLNSNVLFTSQWIIGGCFIISHWEKAITGVLYLPWSYDFGQIGAVFLLTVTFFTSPTIWTIRPPFIQQNVPELIPYFAHGVFWLLSVPISVVNVVLACVRDRAKVPSLLDIVRPLAGNIFVFVISWAWMVYSPSDVMNHSPRIFLGCVGTLTANITSRVILADVVKTKAPMWSNLIGLFSISVFTICFGLPRSTAAQIEVPCLLILTCVITVSHLIFGKTVINEMCDIFKIRAFTVP